MGQPVHPARHRLASSDGPDVVELGNTDMPKYVFNGAFAQIDKSKFENSSTWLTGLSDPCTLDGKAYCVPYYAGARVLIYRTDLLTKSGLQPPTTYADLLTAAAKLKADNASDPNFATFYMPGAYWYAAMSWVYGEGGQIATKGSDGKWTGTLEQAKRGRRSAEVGRPAPRRTARATRPRTRTTRTPSSPRVTPPSCTATAGRSARCSRSTRTRTTPTRRWSTPPSRARSPRFRCRAPRPVRVCRPSSAVPRSASPARARTRRWPRSG